MLRTLTIRDMVLIEAADLEFQPGLNVLTGETGSGKSILLDSLGFVLGWRVRAGLVRPGAERGEVIAEFHVSSDHPVHKVLDTAGLPASDDLILRRAANPDGKRRAWVNDRPVSAETLRALGELLIERHGQHDDRGLMDVKRHLALIDAFGAIGPTVSDLRAAWARRQDAERALAQARAALDEAARDADYLTHAVSELADLDPVEGEEPELDQRRRDLKVADEIRSDVERAVQALGGEGAEGAIVQAARWLEGAAARSDGRIDPVLATLERVLAELAELAHAVDELQSTLDTDPHELEAVEERLFSIRSLARKHQVLPDALPALREELQARLDAIDGGAEAIGALEAALKAADDAYADVARAVSEKRRAAASRLDVRMAEELPPLKLEKARFMTSLETVEPGPDGTDRAQFMATTNPGSPPGAINRIASGGELSRFLLALKVCLAEREADLTLIFDEIDQGVGGATADAVGRRLQALGRDAQVLVVTHSAQVAARGGHHFRVGKRMEQDQTHIRVEPLSVEERTEEIARMLAGDRVTKEARSAARALLDA
ncbi:MAG: DNA repair protein RecN [Pseudomonadota bacterium]